MSGDEDKGDRKIVEGEDAVAQPDERQRYPDEQRPPGLPAGDEPEPQRDMLEHFDWGDQMPYWWPRGGAVVGPRWGQRLAQAFAILLFGVFVAVLAYMFAYEHTHRGRRVQEPVVPALFAGSGAEQPTG